MKKAIVLIGVILYAVASYGQVEFYTRLTKGENIEPDINIYGEKKISKKVNFTYFTLVEKSWAEGFLGFSYAPKEWLSVGLSVGIETNPKVYRFAGSIWTGKEKNSLLLLWEKGDGSDNYWYKVTAEHKFSEKFSLAARAWRYHGIGPVITYTFPKIGVSIFGMTGRDFEANVNRLITGFAIKL